MVEVLLKDWQVVKLFLVQLDAVKVSLGLVIAIAASPIGPTAFISSIATLACPRIQDQSLTRPAPMVGAFYNCCGTICTNSGASEDGPSSKGTGRQSRLVIAPPS